MVTNIFIDWQCKFIDLLLCYIPQYSCILQFVIVCKVTVKTVCKFTLPVYVNICHRSVKGVREGFAKMGGGEFLKSLHWNNFNKVNSMMMAACVR